jgi:hypothetical protein
VFDTWVRNSDRYSFGMENSDNLRFAPLPRRKYALVPIDHTHCFIDAGGDFSLEPYHVDIVEDKAVYGNFPEFKQYLVKESVVKAVRQLETLNREFVVEVVNAVPLQWGLGYTASAALVDMIYRRSRYVVATIADKLITDSQYDGRASCSFLSYG